MNITDMFAEELTAIKRAPRIFLIGFLVLAVPIAVGEYAIFKELLSQKDSLANTLQMQLSAVRTQQGTSTPLPCVGSAATTTGPANTSGPDSPAVSGTVGTLTQGVAATPAANKGKTAK